MSRFIRLAVVVAFLSSLIAHSQVLTTAEAKDHVGDTATVCGTIASENTATAVAERRRLLTSISHTRIKFSQF